jgi:hypothetical protein
MDCQGYCMGLSFPVESSVEEDTDKVVDVTIGPRCDSRGDADC